jgi:4-methyl-5(b-hydroxyethyl)-thiazole monophosphate biosynthesis
MKTRTLIIIPDGFEEIEFCCPFDILVRGGIEVAIAGYKNTNPTGYHGLQVRANIEFSEVGTGTYDCVILPGGVGCYKMRGDTALGTLLTAHVKAGRLVCAICAAPLILHDAGILAGKRYTAHPCTHDELTGAIAESNVVADGSLITASGPGAAADFAFEILAKLTDRATASNMAKFMLF